MDWRLLGDRFQSRVEDETSSPARLPVVIECGQDPLNDIA